MNHYTNRVQNLVYHIFCPNIIIKYDMILQFKMKTTHLLYAQQDTTCNSFNKIGPFGLEVYQFHNNNINNPFNPSYHLP